MDLQLGKINTFTNIIEEAGYSENHKMIWLFMSVRCFETRVILVGIVKQ